MKLTVIALALIASSVTHSLIAHEQRPYSQDKSAASIAGRVALRGEPVAGALVLALPEPPAGREGQASAKTDADGRYQITSLPPGKYTVLAQAPGFASQEGISGEIRVINLDSGDKLDNMDFALVRGGVITGRVSDANDEPVVEQTLSLSVLTPRGWQSYYRPYSGNYEMMTTDDRGVYRIYGLPAGRYKVSVGEGSGSSVRRLDYGGHYYPLTYHPDAREESTAGIVELTVGSEVSGIDIKVGRRERTYEASGRIVNAETGQPQLGIKWGYDGSAVSTFGAKSDENGGFKISGLIPGRYSVFAGCEGDFYSDKVEFDVTDHDVSGLEIKRNQGAGLRGKVVVEGVSDLATLGKLSQVTLSATGNVNSNVESDGSFYFCGLRPGNVKISAYSFQQPGVWLLRVERDGVDLSDGIEVSPRAQLTGLRVVLAYVTGAIRGQVTILNYELPHNVRLQIVARRVGDAAASFLTAQTDDRGRFRFDGLAPGDYELSSGAMVVIGSGAQTPRLTSVKQKVAVSNGSESVVTLVLKLIEK
ncbi:MAG TPA: carboxypeptidase-like regulatory domain-containing protein [Blastocatellia bacterium]